MSFKVSPPSVKSVGQSQIMSYGLTHYFFFLSYTILKIDFSACRSTICSENLIFYLIIGGQLWSPKQFCYSGSETVLIRSAQTIYIYECDRKIRAKVVEKTPQIQITGFVHRFLEENNSRFCHSLSHRPVVFYVFHRAWRHLWADRKIYPRNF